MAAAFGIALILSQLAFADDGFGGFTTVNDKKGARGYLAQTNVGTVSSGANISWVGIGLSDNTEWVQIGLYQGSFKCCSSPYVVHIYYENNDRCNDYFSDDEGAPTSTPEFFSVKNDGETHTYYCDTGEAFTGHEYQFKYGTTVLPFHGEMTVGQAPGTATVEIHPSPPAALTHLGCSSTSCNNENYGIEFLNQADSWILCCGNAPYPVAGGTENPPFEYVYNEWWSWTVCHTYSQCFT